MSPELFELTISVLSAIVTLVLLPLIRRLGILASAWIEAKTHSAGFACATSKLLTLVEEAVRETEQTLVKTLKAENAWDDKSRAAARDAAYQTVLVALGPKGMQEVLGCLKTDKDGLSQRILSLIESYIGKSKE